MMNVVAGRASGPRRRTPLLILAAIAAAFTMAFAAQAQAAPYTAVAWGDNVDGTLGIDLGVEPQLRDVPVAVLCVYSTCAYPLLSGVIELASDRGRELHGQALARLENGSVWGWGNSEVGQVGDGTTGQKRFPVAVCAVGEKEETPTEEVHCTKHLEGVKAIDAGGRHSLAVLNNGTVVEWGEPGDGSVGSVPRAKSGVSGVKAIAAGEGFSLVLLENGTVMAWGTNSSGDLGNGTEAANTEPVPVCAVGEKTPCVKHLSGVKAIAAANRQSLALLEDGTVVAWGETLYGQLGNDTDTNSDVPVAVCAGSVGVVSPCSEEIEQLKEVTSVAVGQEDGYALLASGRVVSWGSNERGALGDAGVEASAGGVTAAVGPEVCRGRACSKKPVPVCAPEYSGPPCLGGPYLSGVTSIAGGGGGAEAGPEGSTGYAWLGSGRVVDWGAGETGELGDARTQNSQVPRVRLRDG
jgi:alpha-tubulin suppressor-like RCC1 family protein